MLTTVWARFDREVLRPEHPLDLDVDETYVVTITVEQREEDPSAIDPDAEHPLTKIERMAVDMGVDDLSARHTWYAQGRRVGPIEDE